MMKLCKDCKHFNEGYYALLCVSPENGLSPINGRPNPRFALTNRSDKNHCSSEGKFFEQKPLVVKPWWKIWGK